MAIFRRNDNLNGATLAKWLRAGQPMPPTEAYRRVAAFTATLLPMAGYDLRPLLRPDNILLADDALVLHSEKASRREAKNPPVVPGFTPPECYTGIAGPASAVYTLGAVLAALLRGHPPPPADTRPATGFPLFQSPNTLEGIVNFSTETDPARRPENLVVLYDLLVQSEQRIYLDYKR